MVHVVTGLDDNSDAMHVIGVYAALRHAQRAVEARHCGCSVMVTDAGPFIRVAHVFRDPRDGVAIAEYLVREMPVIGDA